MFAALQPQDNCLTLCIIPMLVVSTVEFRLFAYFLIIRDRFKISNALIDFYRRKLSSEQKIGTEVIIRDEIFFISEFKPVPKKKFLKVKAKSGKFENFLTFLKVLPNFRNHHQNEEIYQEINSTCFVERVMSIKTIYSKIYEISDKINNAYGIQIITIIAVQFITITTLLYYFTMKIVRWESELENQWHVYGLCKCLFMLITSRHVTSN